ncbi:MAG TPA: BlaI/MecI/CopY family transcriptional regulator [Armatimonadota bacterium]|nr:BlaI/MecI/CopY family transcriptional regulator [Armatimonadota bacterium]
MPEEAPLDLGRRERQIMEVVYQRGQATVGEVREALEDPPSYSAVRAFMNILEEKGYLTHEQVGNRYVYRPTHPRDAAGKAALKRVLWTFYEGSIANSVAALLDAESLSPEELDELTRLIVRAREEGR